MVKRFSIADFRIKSVFIREGGVTRTFAGHIVVRILGRNAHRLTEITEQILTL